MSNTVTGLKPWCFRTDMLRGHDGSPESCGSEETIGRRVSFRNAVICWTAITPMLHCNGGAACSTNRRRVWCDQWVALVRGPPGPLMLSRTARVPARLMRMSARDARGPEDEEYE